MVDGQNKMKNQEEIELLEVIRKYNNGEYPLFTEIDFCSCLFACMKLNGMYEFSTSKLEKFIREKLGIEKFRYIFADIDSRIVIQEGISSLEVVHGVSRDLNSFSSPKVRIHFSKKAAEELILNTNDVYRDYIEEFAEEYKNELLGKTKTIGERK